MKSAMSEQIESNIDEFLTWCATKKGEYQVQDNCNCPMANFATEVHGFKDPVAHTTFVEERGTIKMILFNRNIYRFIKYGIQTYETLTSRIKNELHGFSE